MKTTSILFCSVALLLCCMADIGLCHDHHDHHDHGHHHEDVQVGKMRYSRQANEPSADVHHDHHHDHHDHDHHHHDHHDHHHDHHDHEHHDNDHHDHEHHDHDHHDHDDHHHDDHHDHDHHDHHDHDHHQHHKSDSEDVPAMIWIQAIGSTALISILPYLILYFIPVTSDHDQWQGLLKILLAFASGGLLGDALLHLLPHALGGHHHHHDHDHHHHEHDHHHDHGHGHDHSGDVVVGLFILGGIMTFLLIEKVVLSLNGGHDHGHSHGQQATSTSDKKAKKDSKDAKSKETKPSEKSDDEAGMKVAGYLNLAADAAHNFTDGLAIGASFLVSKNLAWTTVLTILLHEIPHEIGDFAILVRSGCSKSKAMKLQLVTAVGAMLGTFFGLFSGNLGWAERYILPFTAGGFIYIATVSVIPDLLKDTGLVQSFFELLAMCVGVAVMVVIALYE